MVGITTSLKTWFNTVYSALAVDKAISVYSSLYRVIGQSAYISTKPALDRTFSALIGSD